MATFEELVASYIEDKSTISNEDTGINEGTYVALDRLPETVAALQKMGAIYENESWFSPVRTPARCESCNWWIESKANYSYGIKQGVCRLGPATIWKHPNNACSQHLGVTTRQVKTN